MFNNRLATKVKGYCGRSQGDATKALFDQLGKHFVETYLSDVAYHKQVRRIEEVVAVLTL